MKSLAILIFSLMLLTGCTATQPEPIGGACSSTADCATDEVCRLEFCVLDEEVVQKFGFRLVPPNTSVLQPQTVTPAEVSSEEPVSIALIPSVRVAGRLLFINDQNQARSDGPLGILSLERAASTSRSSRQQRLDTDSRFDLFVLPGNYTLTFVPDDAETPPKVWSDISLNLDTDPQLTIPARRIAVSGTVSQPLIRGRAMGMGRAKVVALSDGGASSTVGEADDSGAFRLYLLPDAHTYGLRVTFFEEDASTFEINIKEALECSNTRCNNLLGEDEQFLIQLGAFVSERIPRRIVLDASGEDFVGTSVDFTATFPWGSIRLRQPVDVTGTVNAYLPNGDWALDVKSPIESEFASASNSIELLEDTTSQSISLPRKLNVSLDVLYLEQPVPQSRVEFVPTEGDIEGLLLTTDENGRIETNLDPRSTYRILITPGLANIPRSGLVASASSLSDASRIVLPRPTVVWGQVFEPPGDDEVWNPIEDVTVQIFEDRQGNSLTLGESTTREDGQFKILIPASTATLE